MILTRMASGSSLAYVFSEVVGRLNSLCFFLVRAGGLAVSDVYAVVVVIAGGPARVWSSEVLKDFFLAGTSCCADKVSATSVGSSLLRHYMLPRSAIMLQGSAGSFLCSSSRFRVFLTTRKNGSFSAEFQQNCVDFIS